jgi:hypothetical protein
MDGKKMTNELTVTTGGQLGPHEAGQVTPDMEATYRASITVTLTATRTVEVLVNSHSKGSARRVAIDRANDLIASHKADTRAPWAATEDWDYELELEAGE